MVREQEAAATQQQQQHSVTAPQVVRHSPADEAAIRSPADDASTSKDMNVAAENQHTSTSSATSSSSSGRRTQKGSSTVQSPGSSASLPSHAVKFVIPAFAVAAAIAWLLRRGRSSSSISTGSRSTQKHSQKHRRTESSKQQQQQQQQELDAIEADEGPEPESRLAMFTSDFQLHTQDVQLVARPAALEGLTCVVSEHLPIQGAVTGCGIPSLWPQLPTAASHTSVVHRLVNKGVSIIGQASTQPFNYPSLGDNMRNPAARFRVAGGGATGAVAAVALQQAQLGVGTDWLGSIKIPAACQGVPALVCTPGVYRNSITSSSSAEQAPAAAAAAGDGAAAAQPISSGSSSSRSQSGGSTDCSSSGLDAAAFAAADFGVMRRVAEHLALPGVSDLRGALTQVVVAEDLFSLCDAHMDTGLLCMKRAVLQWAGQEQAGSVQLLPFLESNCRSWTKLATAAGASPLSAVRTASQQPLPPILLAITYAAQLLYHHDLATRYASQVDTAAAAAAAVTASASTGADPDHQQQQQQQQQQQVFVEPDVLAAVVGGSSVSQEELEGAQRLMQEVQELLNTAVKHDVVVVVPCTPSPPPRIDAPAPLLQSWLSRCHAFAALTALGGVPSVVVPVGQLPKGDGPLSVALFGHSRSDQRLLTVAERLASQAQAEYAKLASKQAADSTAVAAAPAAAGHEAEREQQQQQPQANKSKRQQQAELADSKRLAKAEKAKVRGNEAFKQSKYRDAVSAYTEASRLVPRNPVYLSNRALAYLRLFSFEAAEADCTAVLGFPGLSAPDQVKALLRRGTARIHKNELDGATADFKQVLVLEPNNRQAREELRGLAQQQLDLQKEQWRALANRSSSSGGSSAAAAGGGGASSTAAPPLPFMPPGLYPPTDGPGSAAAAAAAAAAAGVDVRSEDLEAMAALLQSGSLPVVLGHEGEAVLGPRGEPVIVGPGGQAMAVGPSGGTTPYSTARKRASRN